MEKARAFVKKPDTENRKAFEQCFKTLYDAGLLPFKASEEEYLRQAGKNW